MFHLVVTAGENSLVSAKIPAIPGVGVVLASLLGTDRIALWDLFVAFSTYCVAKFEVSTST
jgi:hypothetical protein